ncbi:FAD/NAD(P)-binding domain-containing protein [Zopfia rhizophila CBS 207.26]|uniref:FAD/NAD(P)-binding domain-containing protein n=1 Tax=Zopfia rhizophila CBS 207.26 TaxID=1314779 RepID=A0A6A6EUM2_9PEZI|nr:FAD/NAD(P)-binding domain-containing protein [Zopfia rhizophila CBS 207.26]
MTPKIAIIGAGPGGCMLARLLHHKTGLAAMKEAGLYEEFLKLARYDGESLIVCDKKQTTYMRRYPAKDRKKNCIQEAPEIDRVQLRKLLIESVPEGVVQWGYRLLRVESDLSLHFDNRHVERGFDLIIGADGAWSKVRNFLFSEKPFYSGLGGYDFTIPNAEKTASKAYKFINRGSVFAYSDGKALSGAQLGDGSINVRWFNLYDENWMETCGFDPTDLASAKKALKEEVHDWSFDLVKLVDSAQVTVQTRNLYMLPIGFNWEHKRGVTLLGDASNLMTPFAGVGLNTALYDAMLLSRAIVESIQSPDSLDSHIVEYEKERWANAKGAQELTYGAPTDMVPTPGAPRTSIEAWVLRFMKIEVSKWAYPLLDAGVYTFYFFYKMFV